MEEKCEDCRFWEVQIRQKGEGICRRYPPNIKPTIDQHRHYLTEDMNSIFPDVCKYDWCGEFKPLDK